MIFSGNCADWNNAAFASIVAKHSVGGRWIAVVRLRFDERVIYECVRSLQFIVRCTWRQIAGAVTIIARKCPSADSAKQVADRWVTESRLRHNDGDRPVC